MRDFADFMEKNHEKIYAAVSASYKQDDAGRCLVSRNDPWMKEDCWDAAFDAMDQGEYEIALFDWAEIPIDHLSTANIAKSRPIPFVDMDRRIGRLSSDDWENVTQLFQEYAETHYI